MPRTNHLRTHPCHIDNARHARLLTHPQSRRRLGETPFGKRRQASAGPIPSASKGVVTRRESRKRTILTGKLALSRGAFTIDCIIIDLSKSGARIRIEEGAEIGGEVLLVHLREQVAFETRVAWRNGRDIGLEFIRKHDLSQATTAEMKRLRRYCLDFRPTLIGVNTAAGRFRT